MKLKFFVVIILAIIATGLVITYFNIKKPNVYSVSTERKINNQNHSSTTLPQISPLPTNQINPQTTERKILVNMVGEGGLCVSGEICKSEVVIYNDGYYNIYGGKPGDYFDLEKKTNKKEYIPIAKINQLIQEINSLDYDSLYANEFTGNCPITYDGQEWTYSFYANFGIKTFSSCKVVVDLQSPPFSTINKIIMSVTISN